jgi:lipid-binding SYLF domain-containing protein
MTTHTTTLPRQTPPVRGNSSMSSWRNSAIAKRFLWLVLFVSTAFIASPAWADAYQDTINIFKRASESREFFRTAYGYAVFPTIGKGAVGVGGAHGTGRVYEKGRFVGITSMTQLTIGFQLGGQAYSQIIFFQDEDAFRRFTSGRFEFGAEASAVAITAGASAQANTAGTSAGANVGARDSKSIGAYNNGMAIFTVAKGGLMFEASVGGQKFNYKPRARRAP